MSLLPRYLPALLLAAATGCEKDLVNDTPDAAVDATPLLDGDFSCAGVEWPTHVKDPLPVLGSVTDWQVRPISGATVEVRSVDQDMLLAQTTSSSAALNKGKWAASIASGGDARTIYRKASSAGYLDNYAYDPFPEFSENPLASWLLTPQDFTNFFQNYGLTPDTSLGVIAVEVWDCHPEGSGYSASGTGVVEGATIDPPPGAKVIYWDSMGNLDASLTKTAANWSGALVVGVQPGMTDVVIHAGPITYRSWPVMVRANALTYSPRHP